MGSHLLLPFLPLLQLLLPFLPLLGRLFLLPATVHQHSTPPTLLLQCTLRTVFLQCTRQLVYPRTLFPLLTLPMSHQLLSLVGKLVYQRATLVPNITNVARKNVT